MHDRISSRSLQFEALNREDVEASLNEEEECDMLSCADSIVTIQREEADFVRKRLPGHRIILTPLAAQPVDAPEPGNDDQILFVGSAATANVDGLQWFIDHCWEDNSPVASGGEIVRCWFRFPVYGSNAKRDFCCRYGQRPRSPL